MDLHTCIKFANENPVCSVATVEGKQPRVRMFRIWFADETGFYFSTGAPKSVCKQLKSNPKIEVCFYEAATPPNVGKVLRIAGEVEFINDIKLKTKLLEDWPFLKTFVSGPEDPMLSPFKISKGEAWFWTMENNGRESETERIKF